MAGPLLDADHERMTTPVPTVRRSLSLVDLGSLVFLGAVWGAAFLFLRIASPEVGRPGRQRSVWRSGRPS
jgi:hypothetical protein